MHGRSHQRISGPMLFRLLRAAIPQTRSRSICGEEMRGLSLRQTLPAKGARGARQRDYPPPRCEKPAMDTGPSDLIARPQVPSTRQVLSCARNRLSDRSLGLRLCAQSLRALQHVVDSQQERDRQCCLHTLSLPNNASVKMFCLSAFGQPGASPLSSGPAGAPATNLPEAQLSKADVVSLVVLTEAHCLSFSRRIVQGLPPPVNALIGQGSASRSCGPSLEIWGQTRRRTRHSSSTLGGTMWLLVCTRRDRCAAFG